MQNYQNNITVPEELSGFYKTDKTKCSTNDFESEINITRNNLGQISYISYFTPDKELCKQVFYNGSAISKINNYHSNYLYSTELYHNDLKLSKEKFHKDGTSYCKFTYEYNKKNKITRINKPQNHKNILVCYRYDELDRIIERNTCLNNCVINKQIYKYDILDRIIEYHDNNQNIMVYGTTNKNELRSYTITDKIGNVIKVENHFSSCGYIGTDIIVNGHHTTINDFSYVDNIMLKKPYACDEDLDLIISNLFCNEQATKRTDYTDKIESNSMELIDKNINTKIEVKTVPISMRKRILYNIAVGSKC